MEKLIEIIVFLLNRKIKGKLEINFDGCGDFSFSLANVSGSENIEKLLKS